MAAGNGQLPYVVSTPPEVRQRFRPWAESAERIGLFADYLADLRRLNDQLTFSPKRFGKLVYYFPHARLCVYHARTEFFEVHYAVHLDRPLVFVRDITPRHDRPLGQAG